MTVNWYLSGTQFRNISKGLKILKYFVLVTLLLEIYLLKVFDRAYKLMYKEGC